MADPGAAQTAPPSTTRTVPVSTNIAQRATAVASASPSRPRLSLAPTRAVRSLLDGAWWPRSSDPVAELPGLVLELGARYGSIRQLMLSAGFWDSHFRRLAVGGAVVRMGWFATLDPALVIATTAGGDRIDILVVPPDTAAGAARRAMTMAADPANTMRAPAVLAAAQATPKAAVGTEAHEKAVWESEGGHG